MITPPSFAPLPPLDQLNTMHHPHIHAHRADQAAVALPSPLSASVATALDAAESSASRPSRAPPAA
eukprot:6894211-Prymnesium_polylepis.1